MKQKLLLVKHIQDTFKTYLEIEQGTKSQEKTQDPVMNINLLIKDVVIMLQNPATSSDDGQLITFKIKEIEIHAPSNNSDETQTDPSLANLKDSRVSRYQTTNGPKNKTMIY